MKIITMNFQDPILEQCPHSIRHTTHQKYRCEFVGEFVIHFGQSFALHNAQPVNENHNADGRAHYLVDGHLQEYRPWIFGRVPFVQRSIEHVLQ